MVQLAQSANYVLPIGKYAKMAMTMMALAAFPRHHGLPRRSPMHLRFLLALAIKLLQIEGSKSFAITERSWQYK